MRQLDYKFIILQKLIICTVLPLLSRLRSLLSCGPVNRQLVWICFMSKRRNSLLGPPLSMPSSRSPESSVKRHIMSLLGLYVDRLNPLNAPSKMQSRLILNRDTFVFSIVLFRDCRITLSSSIILSPWAHIGTVSSSCPDGKSS